MTESNELTFGVSVDIPFFNRNQGEIASATGEQIQATRNREFLEATIKRDVAVAYRKYRAAAEKLVLYSTQILPRSEENLRTVRAAYGFGEFSVFEVVNEQRRLTENVTGYNRVCAIITRPCRTRSRARRNDSADGICRRFDIPCCRKKRSFRIKLIREKLLKYAFR